MKLKIKNKRYTLEYEWGQISILSFFKEAQYVIIISWLAVIQHADFKMLYNLFYNPFSELHDC